MHISKKRSHEQNPEAQKAALSSKIRKLLSWVADPDIRTDLQFVRDNVLAHARSSGDIEVVKRLLEPIEKKMEALHIRKKGEPLSENPFSDST